MKKVGGPCFDPGLMLSHKVFAPSNDGKTIFCGGYWDGSIGVYFIPRAKVIQAIHRHSGESLTLNGENLKEKEERRCKP
jgi:hypothetical protein